MRTFNLAFDPIPTEHAYHDGQRYQCYNDRCIADREHVEECGRFPGSHGSYIPVLRCEGCGKLYFGVATWEHEDETPPPPPPAKKPEPPKPAEHDAGIILPNLLTV